MTFKMKKRNLLTCNNGDSGSAPKFNKLNFRGKLTHLKENRRQVRVKRLQQ